MKLAVNEIFKTLQGEGPSCGRQAVFLRLSGCNLKCSYCDSRHTWNWHTPGLGDDVPFTNQYGKSYDPQLEVKPMDLVDVDQALSSLACHPDYMVLVITGGEPLLQQKALGQLICRLQDFGRRVAFDRVEIETNGTIVPEAEDDFGYLRHVSFNVSPKLGNSGLWNAKHNPIRYDAMVWHTKNWSSRFKFVCQDERDLDEVAGLAEKYNISSRKIWIMPEGTSAQEILKGTAWIMPEAMKRGWNVSTRLHVLSFNNQRGV